MRTLSIVLLLVLAGCDSSGAPTTGNSAAPNASAKPASSAAGSAAPAGDVPASDTPAGPPADPLDDSGKPQASCDNAKTSGGCTEHYNLGMGEDSAKTRCEADGTWAKGKGCPKEDRVAVCRTDVDRMVYYKNVIAPGNGIPEIKGLCETMTGKFAEVKK